MAAPDKIYIQMSSAIPGIGFVGHAWDNSRNNKGLSEYINKDALMEWAKEKMKHYATLQNEKNQDEVHWGQRNAFQQMIDKINEM